MSKSVTTRLGEYVGSVRVTDLTDSVSCDHVTAISWWHVDCTHEPPLTEGATPLIERCICMHGWSEELALKVLAGYRVFLGWKVAFDDLNDEKLSPSIPIDLMWCQHILDNRYYAMECQLLFGKYICYNPDVGVDVEAHKERIANTKSALRIRYGENYDRDVWNFGFAFDEAPLLSIGTKRARSQESTGG